MNPIQPDLLPTQQVELVRGNQMISRIRELQASGMIVLRMKCEKENGVYEITYRQDWDVKSKECGKLPLG